MEKLFTKVDEAAPENEVFAFSLLDMARDAVIALDPNGRIEYWNASATRMFGYASQESVGQFWGDIFLRDAEQRQHAIWQAVISTGSWEGELTVWHAKDNPVVVLSRWDIERDGAGNPSRILMTSTDIEECSRLLGTSSQATRQSFEELFAHHPDGVFAFDHEGHLISANASLEKLTGYSSRELMSMPLSHLIKRSSLELLHLCYRKAMAGEPQSAEFVFLHHNGTAIDASISLLPNIVNNAIVGVHGIIKDIRERKANERRIHFLANHDGLTGLPNRNLLYDRLQHAIDQARRFNTLVGVLFLDLNRFKIINDSLGHDKGDLLLQTIAERLKKTVRDIDTVARLGGDEFVIVLEHITEAAHVSIFARDLLNVITQPIELAGHTVSVSTSIGASLYPHDGTAPFSLLKNADLAMYSAKSAGLGKFCFYKQEMNDKVIDKLSRENNLRKAIEGRELLLHYQPRLNMHSNEIVAVEALVRWDHPEKGMIYPIYFIQLAEESGMIDALGEWVFTSACQQVMQWRKAGLQPIKVSINVSVKQLNAEFCDMVANALEESGLEPEYVELEITESTLMINLEENHEILLRLKGMGLSLSIDDFGTGYSSLNYLKRLPIDILKIDKYFVRDIGEDLDDTAIVNATIAMAHSMDLGVVAEGVTSYAQLEFLQKAHCDEIQGYLLCQPLPPQEMETYFRTCELRGIQYSWAH